jgi:glycosyltransferase involved in cell wall biosynthesis
LIQLARWISREQIGIVNIHYPGLWGLPFGILRKFLKRPPFFILSLHGMDFRTSQQLKGMQRRIWEWINQTADAIVACSEALASDVMIDLPASADRVFSIHNGVDPNKVLAHAECPESVCRLLEQGRRYLACVATFEWKKGQDLLIKSFASMAEERPDLDLVLAGRRTEIEDEYRSLAMQLGVADRVHFLRDLSHQNAMAVIREATLLVLPSRYEPFGIVLIEAGLHGTPVIAANVGGIKEIITHEVHGLLVPPENVEALSHAISGLLDNQQHAQRLAEQLHKRVQLEFTWNRATFRYLRLAGLYHDE